MSEVSLPRPAARDRSFTRRMPAALRRAQLIEAAAARFAASGLNGTRTADLAAAAGISEPILYLHFENKTQLFREAVARNVEIRLGLLERRLGKIREPNLPELLGSMAETTTLVCVDGSAAAALTNWALLETPEFALDLHRCEAGRIQLMWERQLDRLAGPESRTAMSILLLSWGVQVSLSQGFRLALLGHTKESAGPLSRDFAAVIAETAAILSAGNGRDGRTMPSSGPKAVAPRREWITP